MTILGLGIHLNPNQFCVLTYSPLSSPNISSAQNWRRGSTTNLSIHINFMPPTRFDSTGNWTKAVANYQHHRTIVLVSCGSKCFRGIKSFSPLIDTANLSSSEWSGGDIQSGSSTLLVLTLLFFSSGQMNNHQPRNSGYFLNWNGKSLKIRRKLSLFATFVKYLIY